MEPVQFEKPKTTTEGTGLHRVRHRGVHDACFCDFACGAAFSVVPAEQTGMTLLGSRIIPGSPESDMRSLLVLVVAMIFAAAAAAQQNENQQSAQPQAQSANQQ